MRKLFLLLLLVSVRAMAQTSPTCNQSDVQTTITNAVNGATVIVPGPCTAAWGTTVTIPNTKGITVQASGTVTVTTDGFQLNQGSSTSRITGFTFTGPNPATANCTTGTPIQTSGAPGNAPYRLDHNTFTNSAQVIFVCVSGNGPGLLDHNTFTGGGASEEIHNLGVGSGNNAGWQDNIQPGSANMVIIEDNTFTSSDPTFICSGIETFYGGRNALRHNTFNFCQVDQHGTAGAVGSRWWEVYNNNFNVPNSQNQCCFVTMRGGTGVIFSNTTTGTNTGGGTIDFQEEDSGTWPLAYQVGSGINGFTNGHVVCGAVNNAPAYVWGNGSMPVGNSVGSVVLGRDYFTPASQPATMNWEEASGDTCSTTYAYTPYTYPDPLIAGGPATYPAAGCSVAQVQAAVTAEQVHPLDGDIITIPSCALTAWASGISITNTNSLTIQGASTVAASNAQGNPATFNDNTNLQDTHGGFLFKFFSTGGSSKVVRVTGLTIQASGAGSGELEYDASVNEQIRIDHNHFLNLNPAVEIFGGNGVADHNLAESPGQQVDNEVQVDNGYAGNFGGNNFNTATGFGGPNFFFMENNTWTDGFMNDCLVGGKIVIRYNTITISTATNGGAVQEHATGAVQSPPWRGCRAIEVYKNVATGLASGQAFGFAQLFSATGLEWGNTVTNYTNDIYMVNDRDCTGTGQGCPNNYVQSAPPAGWGYCGNAQSGSNSNWDGNQNLNGSNGSPCLDQPGRGQSDLITGSFPNVCDATSTDCTNSIFTGRWPQQKLEPFYQWMETQSSVTSGFALSSHNNNIVANRDVYIQASGIQTSATSPFNGTSGTGWGTLANRPTICTAGIGGTFYSSPTGSYGVGYFDTGANALYVCTAANTWTSYYTPYTYPHPLVGGSPSSATPGFISESGKNSMLTIPLAASGGSGIISASTCASFSYCLPFAESVPSPGGNLGIAAFQYANSTAVTSAVTDDASGGSNAWTCIGSSLADGATNKRLNLCYAPNLKSGTHKVTVGFSGTAVTQVQADIAQFFNVATSAPARTQSSYSVVGTSSTTMTGPTLTTVVGDLVYAMFCRTGTPVMTAGSFNPGAGFLIGLTKLQDGCASEWQIATSTSVQPTMTMGTASTYIVFAAAFIPSATAAGTQPAQPYLRRMMSWSSQHPVSNSSFKFQLPNSAGDLLVMTGAGASNYLGTSITDSGTNAWTLAGQCTQNSNASGDCTGSGGYSYEFYNQSAPTANITNTQTVNFTGSGDTTIFFYDFAGSFTFNTRKQFSSVSSTTNVLPVSPGFSFTPGSLNALTVAIGPIAFNTAVSVASPSGTARNNFDAGAFGGESIDGGATPESIIDQNNIFSHSYTSVSGAQNWLWGGDVHSSPNNVGVDLVSFASTAATSNTTVTVTTDGAGSSHVGTAMTTALSYTNPGASALNGVAYPGGPCTTSGTSICYAGSTLIVTGSLCTSAAPCSWTLKDQNGDSINASTLTLSTSPQIASIGTYTSGITATGTSGQTCTLNGFNNNSGIDALATVALTGTNTIASGKALVIISPGAGFTSAPTTATASNGTATCSGTATIATTVRGPVTPLGQIDCSGSAANTTCNYNAPLNYPSTQVVTIGVTDGTTAATATVGFAYLNNLNEYFTHRGRTISNPCVGLLCPFTTVNNIPWNLYAKATTPVTYQPLIITFQNTVAAGLEASILSMSSDPGYGILMPVSPGSGINRPTMSYNGKWVGWTWDTPMPGGGSTGPREMFQRSDGSAIQREICTAANSNATPEKNRPNWFITNNATFLQVCDVDNAQTVTTIATHGLPTVGSSLPVGFSYEAGANDSVYGLRTVAPNPTTCPAGSITVGCSLTFAAFDLTSCYTALSATCASQVSGSPWSSFVNNTGIGGSVQTTPYGWEAGGAVHCSNPRLAATDIPAPNCEWHIHDVWFVPKTNILSIDYGPFGSGGEAIQYAMPAGGGTFDSSLCATPPTWPTVTTVTCFSPNVVNNLPFFSHPAFNQAQNFMVTYAGSQTCGNITPSLHDCPGTGGLGNGITNLNTNTSIYYDTVNSYGHAAWDGYDTNHFGHDTTLGNTADITFGCNTQTLREVNISAVTDTPLGYFGCRPTGSTGGAASYTLSPVQSSDGTKLLYSMDTSMKSGEPGAGNNIDFFLLLGWVLQTRKPAPPVSVSLSGSTSATVQWTGAALNRETMLYWVYRQPSCTGSWTRAGSAAPVDWTTTGFVPSTQTFIDPLPPASGSNACYGVTSQEWTGAESGFLSNTIKISNASGTFSSTAVAAQGTVITIPNPSPVGALTVAKQLLCATACAAVNTPHAPTLQSVASGSLTGTYYAMVVYGKCIDFPNCTNFQGTLPSLASSPLALSSQNLKVNTFNTEMVGQDAVQIYVSNTTATPASVFHLQTPTTCSPVSTILSSTIVLMNNFNVGSANTIGCTFSAYNAAGAIPPTTNTAVGGYQLTWTDPGGLGNRYMQIYYSEGSLAPITNELTAQPYLIATPPVGTQSFYDAFPNQAVSAANIHYAVVTKNMDGTRSLGSCMNGAGTTEVCAGTSGTFISLSPNSVAFGNQNVNTTSSPTTVTLSNVGSNTINVTNVVVSANFARSGGSCVGNSFSIAVSASCTMTLTFTPTSGIAYNGALTITSNSSTSPDVVTLSGQGVNPVLPTVSLTPNPVAFGNQNINTTSPVSFATLTNIGSSVVNVTSMNVFGVPFSRSGGTCGTGAFSLPVGNACTIGITFSPTTTTAAAGTLSVNDNASGSPQVINLTGQGTQATIVWSTLQGGAAYNFGNVPIGTPSTSSALTLTNTGTGPLTVNVSPGAVPQFTVLSTTCLASLPAAPAANSCTYTVQFIPTATVSYTSTLTETDPLASNSPQSVTLRGAGFIPPVTPIAPFAPDILLSKREK